MATASNPPSWIMPQFDWQSDDAVVVTVGPDADDVVLAIADDRVVVRVMTDEWLCHFRFPVRTLHTNLMPAVAIKANTSSDGLAQCLLPDCTPRTVSFALYDLFRVSDHGIAVVVGHDRARAYGHAHPAHLAAAKNSVEAHFLQHPQDQPLAAIAHAPLRLADFENESAAMVSLFLRRDPRGPLLSATPISLPYALLVRDLPRATRARTRVVLDAVLASGQPPSRDGRYTCIVVCSEAGRPAVLVQWAPRGSTAPAPELKAALERRYPSALHKPRHLSPAPPPDIPADPDPVITSGDVTSLDPLVVGPSSTTGQPPDDGLSPGLLEERLQVEVASRVGDGAAGGTSTAVAEVRAAIRKRGIEALGWYQPFHYYAEPVWGIYLHAPRLDALMHGLAEDFRKTEPYPYTLAAYIALNLVTHHELFHAHAEFAASWLELASHHRHYVPSRERSSKRPSLKHTEEALANWSSYTWLTQELRALHEFGRVGQPQAVTEAIELWLDLCPPGYRDWRVCRDYPSWQTLSGQLLPPSRHSLSRKPPPLALEGLHQSASLFELLPSDVPTFFYGHGIIADTCFCGPSRRELLAFLAYLNYARLNSHRGKGSHEAWRGPDGNIFPVPHRDPVSSGVFKGLLRYHDIPMQKYNREIRHLLR